MRAMLSRVCRPTAVAAILLVACVASAAEPGHYSPNCYRGETFTRVITWRDSAGTLIDLTGYSAKIQIRDTVTKAVLDEFAVGTGLTLGGALGTITWEITPAETLAFPTGNLAYDLRMTSAAGVVTYLLYGHVNVSDTRTR